MPPEDDKNKTDQGGNAGGGATTGDTPAVTFKTREEFHREVDRKANAAAKKAAEDAQAKFLEDLGIESLEDLPKIKETIAASAKTVTEAEKLKAAHDKLTKEHQKAIARGDGFLGKLKGIARRDALAPFAGKVTDMETLSMFADRDFEVDDDGAVTVKAGKGGTVEDWFESLLKSKPYLKAPAAAQGAGTTAAEPRAAASTTQATNASGGANATTANTAQNGTTKQSIGQLMVSELIKAGKLAAPQTNGP